MKELLEEGEVLILIFSRPVTWLWMVIGLHLYWRGTAASAVTPHLMRAPFPVFTSNGQGSGEVISFGGKAEE